MKNDLTLYTAVREEMYTGGILLWSSKKLLGDLIKRLGPEQSALLGEHVNHASVVVRLQGITTFRLFNYESDQNGFEPHFLSHELERYEGSVFWCELKPGMDRAVIEERAFHMDGTPYGYKKLLFFPVGRPNKGDGTAICSEAADEVVTGEFVGKVRAPGELLDLGYWEDPIKIL